MIFCTPEDLTKLSHSVRRFLMKLGFMPGATIKAELRLVFPDMSSMQALHRVILQEMSKSMLIAANNSPVIERGPDTVEIQIGGMSIVLTCEQSCGDLEGRRLGYNNVKWFNQGGWATPPSRG